MTAGPEPAAGTTARDGDLKARGRVKCVVWDLDGTVWEGTLLEDTEVVVRPHVVEALRRLDGLGILNSIASKNDHDLALQRLEAAGIADLFLYPQINWNPKSTSLQRIATALDIGIDALALVDDQPFELAEVQHTLPEVLGVSADGLVEALEWPELRPRFVTNESRQRRQMYLSSAAREQAEREFVGTSQEFLATLDMHLRICPAGEEHLQRAEELTVRTNQLNSTGRAFGYDELAELSGSPDHLVLVASLDDRWGSYGTIGLALVEKAADLAGPTGGPTGGPGPCWRLLLLLTSCRVVSRGVGTVLLNHIMRLARDAGAQLVADFVDTGRNRMMYLTYAFAGFREVGARADADGGVVLQASLDRIQPPPPYLHLEVAGSA